MLNRNNAPDFQTIGNLEIVSPESVKYANGLQVYLFDAPELELLKFEFVFENRFLPGLLSLNNVVLSSMLKEGTSARTSAQIAEEVDFYGAYLMPEYSYDYTSLTLYTIRRYVNNVLPILADILNDSIIPQQELDTYKKNNKQSLQIALQKNEVLARRLFFQNVFGKNQYGSVVNVSDYDQITRDSVMQVYREQIRPDNCTLLVAGKIDTDLLNTMDALFGESWGNTGTLGEQSGLVLTAVEGKTIIEPKGEALQSAIRLGGLTINRKDPDFPAVQFVNTLLGGYFGSRLMRNIREEKGYTYGISSGVISLKHSGMFVVASEVGVDVTGATMTEIEKEFKRLREESVGEDEIDLVRNYMQGSLLGSLESVFSHVDKFKAVYFSGLDLSYYESYQDVIRNIGPKEVQEIAARYFDYDKLVKVIVGKYE